MFTPRSLHAPPQFQSWRPAQLNALLRIIDSDERFIAVVMPAGTGKSLLAWSIAQLSGERTLILTASRYLEDQYSSDFSDQVVDIRGQQNYPCRAVQSGQPLHRYGHNGMMCDRAPCHHGVKCALMFGGCSYYDQQQAAAAYDGAVSSNYSYWLSHGKAIASGRKTDEPLGQFGVLVCDESHETVSALRSALRVELDLRDVHTFINGAAPIGGSCSDWASWSGRVIQQVEAAIDGMKHEVSLIGLTQLAADSLRRLRRVRECLDMIATIDRDWCITESNGSVVFEAVHPKRYSEQLLWRSIPKVVLMSATVTRKDVAELIDE